MSIVIQGETDDELPEQMLGALHFNYFRLSDPPQWSSAT
jgi:hypothetical protein